MKTLFPFFKATLDFVIFKAQLSFPLGREVNFPRLDVPIPQPRVGRAHREPHSLLAHPERFDRIILLVEFRPWPVARFSPFWSPGSHVDIHLVLQYLSLI